MASFLAHFDAIAPEYESNRLGPWYIAHGEFIAGMLARRTLRQALTGRFEMIGSGETLAHLAFMDDRVDWYPAAGLL